MSLFTVVAKNGQQITLDNKELKLSSNAIVKLKVNHEAIKLVSRQDSDLIIQLTNGEQLVIKGFFADAADKSQLVLEQDNGSLWWLDAAGTKQEQLIAIEKLDEVQMHKIASGGMLAAWSLATAALAGTALIFASGSKHHDDGSKTEPESKPVAPSHLQLVDINGNSIVKGQVSGLTTLYVQGKAQANSTVTIYDNGNKIGSVLSDSQGNWLYEVSNLTKGSHSFTATVTDSEGRTSSISESADVNVSTTEPEVLNDLSLNDGSGNEISTDDHITDRTPTISGHAAIGSTVTIYDNGNAIGQVTATSEAQTFSLFSARQVLLGTVSVSNTGKWTFTASKLAFGSHNFVAEVMGASGEITSKSSGILFYIDPAAIDTTSTSFKDSEGHEVTNGFHNETKPSINGKAEPNCKITIYDHDKEIGTVRADGSGNWQFKPEKPLDQGSHSFTFKQSDDDGHTSAISNSMLITIDTTPPEQANELQLHDEFGQVIGSVSNHTQPTLSGTAEAGSTVQIFDGKSPIGRVTVDNNGHWTFTPDSRLAEGDHSLSVTVTDPAGNTSAASKAITITIDTTAPEAASELSLTDASGAAMGAVSNQTQPTLSGTAEAGSTVQIFDGKSPIGSVTVDNNGHWTFTPDSRLAEGAHSLSVTVTDPAGNTSAASKAITITIDTTAPAAASDLSLTDASGAAMGAVSNHTQPTLSGTAEAGSTVQIFDGKTPIGSVTVDNNGHWTFTPDSRLAEGDHSLSVTVTDPAGNTSAASKAIKVTIDTTAPAAASDLSLTDASGAAMGAVSNQTQPTLSGTAEAGSTVQIFDGKSPIGSVTVDNNGHWTFTPTNSLAEGDHSLSVTVTDPAGNTSAASKAISITIDTTAPEAASDLSLTDASGAAMGAVSNQTQPILSGTAEAGSTVQIFDGKSPIGSVTVDNNGHWAFTPTNSLAEGDHSLSVTVTDPAGNTSAASKAIKVTIDTTAPEAASELSLTDASGAAMGAVSNQTQPTLSGTAEAGSTVQIFDGKSPIGSVTVDNNGHWTFTPTNSLAEGDHSLSVTVTDPAGNTSAASKAINVTIDTTAPAAASDLSLTDASGAAMGAVSNQTQPTPSGTAEAGSTVQIFDGKSPIGSVTVDNNGHWTFTPDSRLAEGAHSLSVTVTDPAGNTSAASKAINVTIDTTAPELASDLQLTDGTGQSVAGGETDDNNLTLSGRAEAGSTVSIYDGENIIGTAVTDSQGNWSFSPNPALAVGQHQLTVTVTDAAGNTKTEHSAAINIHIISKHEPTELQLNPDNATSEIGATHDNLNGTTGDIKQFLGVSLLKIIDLSVLSGNSFSFKVQDGTTEEVRLDIAGSTALGSAAIVQQLLALLGVKKFTSDLSIVDKSTGKVVQIIKDAITITAEGVGLKYTGNVDIENLTAGDYTALMTAASTDSLLGKLLDFLVSLNIGVSTKITIQDSVAYTATEVTGNVISGNGQGDIADHGDGLTVITVQANDVAGSGAVTLSSEGAVIQGKYGTLTLHPDGSYSYQSKANSDNIGKSETFTYTVKDAYRNTASTTLTINVEGSHSHAVTDEPRIDVTTEYAAGVKTEYNSDSLATSGNQSANQSSKFDLSSTFSIDRQHVLNNGVITLNLKVSKSGIQLSGLNSTFEGKLTIYRLEVGSDGKITKQAVYSEDFTQMIQDLLLSSKSANVQFDLSKLSLPEGNYEIDLTGAVTSSIKTDYSLASDMEGTVVDTSTHFTKQETVEGNLLHDVNSANISDTLGALFQSFSITGNDSNGKQHTWTFDRHGTIADSLSGTLSDSSVTIRGKYGVLTVQADGSYRYVLDEGIDINTIVSKETFSYTLNDSDGKQSAATISIDFHPTITGSSNGENLHGSAYNDTFTAGEGVDTLVYNVLADDGTGGNGSDTWTDFAVNSAEKIDISDLLVGWDGQQASLSAFISVTHSNGNTIISIDRDGSGNNYHSSELLTLKGVTITLDELINKHIVADSTLLQANDDSQEVTINAIQDNLNGITGKVNQAAGITQSGNVSDDLLNSNSFSFTVAAGSTEDLRLNVSGSTALSLDAVVKAIQSILGGKDATADISIIDRATGKVVQIIEDAVTITSSGTGLSYSGRASGAGLPAGEYTAAVTTESSGSILSQLLDILSRFGLGTSLTMDITDSVQYTASSIAGNVIHADGAGSVADKGDELKVLAISTATGQQLSVTASGTTIQGQYGKLTIFADGSYHYQTDGSRDSLGKTDHFTYTLTDAHDNKMTAELAINANGTESKATDDIFVLQDTTHYSAAVSQVYDSSALSSSGKVAKNKTSQISNTMDFTVNDQHVLQSGHITLKIKMDHTSIIDFGVNATLAGRYILYKVINNADGSTSKVGVWRSEINETLSGLNSKSGSFSFNPGDAGLDLSAGKYQLEISGTITTKHDLAYDLSRSVSGDLVDTATQYTTEQTLSGNIHENGNQGTGADVLGSLYSYLSISGNDQQGVQHTWQLNAQGGIKDSNGNQLAGDTLTLYGNNGVLTLNTDGSYSYKLYGNLDINTITSKDSFSYTLHDSNGHSSSAEISPELHLQISGSVNNDTFHSTPYDDIFTTAGGADSLVYQLLADDNNGGNGTDTWKDFSITDGDHIDVSALLVGWDGQDSSLGNYISVTQDTSGNTLISIDRDGKQADHYQASHLLTLEGVKVTFEELFEQHSH